MAYKHTKKPLLEQWLTKKYSFIIPQKGNYIKMQEVWKNITGYDGYHQVSNLGRVRSVDRMVKGKKERLQHG